MKHFYQYRVYYFSFVFLNSARFAQHTSRTKTGQTRETCSEGAGLFRGRGLQRGQRLQRARCLQGVLGNNITKCRIIIFNLSIIGEVLFCGDC